MTTATATRNGKATTKAAEEPAATPMIDISRIQVERMNVPIRWVTPLIVHAWSEKAMTMILDAQQGRKAPKERRDPEADYQASLYRLPDGGYGFPTDAFKAAIVSAARFFGKDVTMVGLRQSLFLTGEAGSDGLMLTRIEGEPRSRRDMVRIGQGSADVRFRGEFVEWRASLAVTYVKSLLSRESVLSLIDAAGMGVGVGEWRPERRGQFGTFEIDPDREIGASR
jgi:hypothetical protein